MSLYIYGYSICGNLYYVMLIASNANHILILANFCHASIRKGVDVFYKKCCISIDTSVYRNMYPVKLMLNVVPIWLCVALQLTSFPIWELFLMWILPILFLEHNEKINLPIRSFGFLLTQTSIIIIHWWRLNTIGYKLYVMTRYCFQLYIHLVQLYVHTIKL